MTSGLLGFSGQSTDEGRHLVICRRGMREATRITSFLCYPVRLSHPDSVETPDGECVTPRRQR
jgi:hypothetical protein